MPSPTPLRAVDRLTAETTALFGARRAVGHMGACVIHTSVPRILAQLARSENAAIRLEAARLADEIDRP